jgi:hypothetical protein
MNLKINGKVKTMKKQIIKEDSLGNFSFENIKKKKFKISKAIILLILPIFIFIFSCKEQKTEPPLIEPIKTEPTLLEVYKKDTDNLKIFIFKLKTLFN